MSNILGLEGKTAVVVGGTSGIGRALSLGLAEAGADVIASARRKEQVEETAAAIEASDRRTLRVASDVSDRASLENLLAQVLEHFGKVDILINCAGKIKRAPTLTFPEDEWQSIIDTNLTGTLRACQIFGKHMLERGYGRIVNIASLNTYVALAEVAAYAQQSCRRLVNSLARRRMVEAWSAGQRHCAWRLPDRIECGVARQYASRQGAADAHADGPLWKNRRGNRRSHLSCFGRCFLRHRTSACR